MRRAFAVLCCVIRSASLGWAADMPVPSPEQRWNETFSTEVRFFSWQGNRGYPTAIPSDPGHGTELYIPFAAQLVGRPNDDFKVELLARGGKPTG